MGKEPTIANIFVDELYGLFGRWQKKFFVGSYEQARLLLQLKLRRFIPVAYLKHAFRTLQQAGLMEDTRKTTEFGPIQIGDVIFAALSNGFKNSLVRKTFVRNWRL